MDPMLAKLYRQPLFDSLNEDELEGVAPLVRARVVRSGDDVFRQGDEPDFFYMVSAGQVEVLHEDEAGRRQRVNLLYPGEFFGDVSLLTDEPRGVTVRATTDSELLLLERADFEALIESYSGLEATLTEQGSEIEERATQGFEGKLHDEVVIYQERRHWIVVLQRLTKVAVALLLWFVGMTVAYFAFRTNVAAQLWAVAIGLAVLLIPAAMTLWEVLDWYNDFYIVTNQRVIHIEKVIFFQEERFEAPLSKIQNVTVAQTTPLGEILGYGKLVISTAAQGGTDRMILLDHLPRPDVIAERIIMELNRTRTVLARQEREQRRQTLRAALGFDAPPDGNAAPPDAPPPSAPVVTPTSALLNPVRRLLRYLRPVMREQNGTTVIWRMHWILLLIPSLPWYALFFLVLGATIFIPAAQPLSNSTAALVVAVGTLLSLLVLARIWWLYDDWRNDLYILTQDAILDEEKQPLGFNKEVRRAPLETIQDIRYVQGNFFMVWLGVGNVLIQTAGAQGDFTFDWVKNPQGVQYDIFQAIQSRATQRQRSEAAAINQEFLEMLKIYEEERTRERPRDRPAPPPEPPTPRGPSDPDAETRRTPGV